MMEKAAPPALGGQFNISVDNIQVTVVESRRLSEDVRRLAGTFAIAFVITVPPGKAAALAVKVEAAKTAPDTFKKEFATVAKAQLVAAGVPQATVDNLSVSALIVTATYKPMTTGTGPPQVVRLEPTRALLLWLSSSPSPSRCCSGACELEGFQRLVYPAFTDRPSIPLCTQSHTAVAGFHTSFFLLFQTVCCG